MSVTDIYTDDSTNEENINSLTRENLEKSDYLQISVTYGDNSKNQNLKIDLTGIKSLEVVPLCLNEKDSK